MRFSRFGLRSPGRRWGPVSSRAARCWGGTSPWRAWGAVEAARAGRAPSERSATPGGGRGASAEAGPQPFPFPSVKRSKRVWRYAVTELIRAPLVLIVDDDESLRLLCRVNLELDGYRGREVS